MATWLEFSRVLCRSRDRSAGAARRADPGIGPQSHRAGHRVRLLLRPRGPRPGQPRPARRRLRDRDDQLQPGDGDRKSTRLNSSHVAISYAVFCLKKKKKKNHELSYKKK